MTSTYGSAEQFRSLVLWFIDESNLSKMIAFIKELPDEDKLIPLALELAISRLSDCNESKWLCINVEEAVWKRFPWLKERAFRKWSEFSREAIQKAKSKEEILLIAEACPEDLCKSLTDRLLDFPLIKEDVERLNGHTPELVKFRIARLLPTT